MAKALVRPVLLILEVIEPSGHRNGHDPVSRAQSASVGPSQSSHGLAGANSLHAAPALTMRDASLEDHKAWILDRLELVSLLKFEEPQGVCTGPFAKDGSAERR